MARENRQSVASHRQDQAGQRLVIILVGPSGCGKTAVGQALAQAIQGQFLDADDFHTPEARALMHSGQPLEDDQRWPWLERIREAAIRASSQSIVVLACSALKPAFRRFLREGNAKVQFVSLDVNESVLRQRLSNRKEHFFPASLLDSQMDDWQPLDESEGVTIDGDQPIEAVVQTIRQKLQLME